MPLWPNRQFRNFEWNPHTNAREWMRATGVPAIHTSQAWASAYQIVYSPVFLPYPGKYLIGYANGAVVSGIIAYGCYTPDSDGLPSKLIPGSMTIEPQVTINFFKTSYPALWYPAGLIFFAFQCSSVTAQVLTVASLSADYMYTLGSIFIEARSEIGLPAIATPNTGQVACKVPHMSLFSYD